MLADLQKYIDHGDSSALISDRELRELILERIATRENGPFLRVKVALDSRKTWRTLVDIKQVLDNVPREL